MPFLTTSRYWLPSFLKHKYVALQFISQDAYERAALLEVSLKPDVIQRVFMLFKGIDRPFEEPGEWYEAEERTSRDVYWWRDVVGLHGEAGGLMRDESLFRVLEWGGMEILRK